MARQPKPWYRKDRDAWFVTVAGTRHNLGPHKKQAMERFYALMREPKAAKVASTSFAAIADAFLDWLTSNRAQETYGWYQYRLERFCQRYPDLVANEIRPYHVQQWVDSYEELSKTSRRNYVRSVKRCVKWRNNKDTLKSTLLWTWKCQVQRVGISAFLPTSLHEYAHSFAMTHSRTLPCHL